MGILPLSYMALSLDTDDKPITARILVFLRTCRLVYWEAAALFYHRDHLVLSSYDLLAQDPRFPKDDVDRPGQFWTWTSPVRSVSIKHLTVSFQFSEHYIPVCRRLRVMTELKTIRFVVQYVRGDDEDRIEDELLLRALRVLAKDLRPILQNFPALSEIRYSGPNDRQQTGPHKVSREDWSVRFAEQF
ncbi:hypothetical protein CLAFUW4_04415 [Fulvia fulva]|uniref:Uncharacterized protein n=1 Tax=Passalora fulva TaxID=5499 RepID=A0A9Q8LE63_PASFU|nr:uncharacterized protein CLAFUR5_04378 [Fulvia fulva]KAK4627169.1 hypothetical protein CLAFUR4_04401 [Fulvia fulva]KAK4628328.1 hypothetical protein CLAFUR0_04403 [Fulvia fulva]UJO15739.1 hypothetical protein CLAFUR5_04378 [Fulvia fulva]WPV14196.1 hypothetical protein CLAFUW4_04415 [Fulvia fulva]WPV28062.1 hypothetical protein CLAFUW7_04405 [Fulvia fulva]